MTRKVAVVVGSIRKDSINRKLAKALVKLAPKNLECDLVKIDDLPVFNQARSKPARVCASCKETGHGFKCIFVRYA